MFWVQKLFRSFFCSELITLYGTEKYTNLLYLVQSKLIFFYNNIALERILKNEQRNAS